MKRMEEKREFVPRHFPPLSFELLLTMQQFRAFAAAAYILLPSVHVLGEKKLSREASSCNFDLYINYALKVNFNGF